MWKQSFSSLSLCCLLTLALLVAPVAAQSHNVNEVGLRVTVYDPNGALIAGAQVELLTKEGAVVQTSASDERGVAVFTKLAASKFLLRVAAQGFEPQTLSDVNLRAGANTRDVHLAVADVKEDVTVAPDIRERRTDSRGDSFSTVLTADQIAQLPDDPDEMEQVLQQMAGPGATIRVNGFRGGKLPPKSQIREIRFHRNPYATETHEMGFHGVDILTKPGTDNVHASFNFGFRDEALAARSAFAPRRAPEQTRRSGFTLDVPLWRKHTSLFINGDSNVAYDSKTILAALPDGTFNSTVRRPSRTLNLGARLEHVLTKTHTLRAEYQRNAVRQDNLGVGDFSLFDRAYTSDTAEHVLRAVDSGLLTEKLVNEFRFQARWQSASARSASDAPALQVLNAFTRGGAGLDSDRHVREYEVGDNVDFAYKQHTMRAGVLAEVGRYESRDARNTNGTFTFASLADFNAARPTTYTQRAGDASVALTQYQLGAYWQDDWRARKNLTLSYGVRYEWQNHLREHNNFAPRAGLAWSPFKKGGTTIRAGAGVFYDWFGADTYEQTLRINGARQRETVINNPGYPDPFAGGNALVLPASRYTVAPDLQMPYIAQASVGIEHELLKRFRLMSEYRYQRGLHQLRGRNLNAPVTAGFARPDPAAGNVIQVESSATLTRHEWNIGLGPGIGKLGGRAFWFVNYALAKTTNDADGAFALPANNYDLSTERGPAATDVRHRFFAMLDMRLLKGVRVANFFNFLSAPPYTVTTGRDDNGDTISNDRPFGVTRNSARSAAQWNMSTRLSYRFGWGKPKATAGGGPRMVAIRVDGEGGGVSGLPGAKSSRWNMEFYAQAFNLFNHVNRVNYTGVLTSPFYGQAIAALPGRRIETGIRFSF